MFGLDLHPRLASSLDKAEPKHEVLGCLFPSLAFPGNRSAGGLQSDRPAEPSLE